MDLLYKMVLVKLRLIKNIDAPLLTYPMPNKYKPCSKVNSKCIKDFNIRSLYTIYIEKNIDRTL